ncbi:hypothetical protein N9Y42_01285 [Mariniblastus sp.]|nr:hypothetical protein [Mariniblastus sp.]
MLSLNSLFMDSCRTLGLAAVIASSALVGISDAQQTPAQRSEPVRSNVYDNQKPNDYYPEQVHREGVRQIGYQQPAEPAVPAILSGAKNSAAAVKNALSLPAPGSAAIGSNTQTMPMKTAADYASQMGVRPTAFAPAKSNYQAPTVSAKTATIPVGVIPQRGTLPTPVAPVAPAIQPVAPTAPQVATESAVARTNPVAESNQTRTTERFASDRFSNDLRAPATQPAKPVAQVQVQTPQPPKQTPAQTVTVTAEPIQKRAIQDQNVQPTSANMPVVEKASINIAAPSIEVVTVGPQTIGINKPSEFKVVVRNNSTIRAERILIGIDMPEWVDIENLSLTSGGKELTDGTDQARLVWSVDQVPGNSSQTMTISAIPRKAEIFDVGVEWTLVPLVGKASIRVTEPKLEMSISGPKEVQYGETALYHVAVRNPGTGAAENVSVMLPEALGGERATLGVIPPGKEKHFQVELLARAAGELNLVATAAGEGNLKADAERALVVRRAALDIAIVGPPLKYAGGIGKYSITLTNTGDATANELVAAVALPSGVKYLKGIDAVKLIDAGMRWPVGSLATGETRTFEMYCQLDTSGDLQLEVAARGKPELAASSVCKTTVETVADLVLSVADLKGPLPTGEQVPYTIKIRNRGTKAAKGVNLVMQFSDGIEPLSAKGLEHQIAPGKVVFSPISNIAPGQEMTFEVNAEAYKGGTHIFRAQLTCEDSDSREIAEGTTRYFGDTIDPPAVPSRSPAANTAESDGKSFR